MAHDCCLTFCAPVCFESLYLSARCGDNAGRAFCAYVSMLAQHKQNVNRFLVGVLC